MAPRGDLAAYVLDLKEVYVRAVNESEERIQVSNGGGREPEWSRDGRVLYYRGPRHVIAATIQRTPTLRVTRRDTLFLGPFYRPATGGGGTNFDVLPSGEFLMLQGGEADTRMFAIVNWLEDVKPRSEAASNN